MHITNYHYWSMCFSILFVFLLVVAVYILHIYAHTEYSQISVFEFILLILATLRLTRLLGRDHVTSFLRDQLYIFKEVGEKKVLEKPTSGPRLVLIDLISCPWCLSIWSAFVLSFLYLLFESFFYIILILALSASATCLQLFCASRKLE